MSGIKSKNCINCSADLENAENQNPSTSAFYTLNCSSRVRSPLSPATVELIPVPHALSTIFNFQTLEKVSKANNNNYPDDGDGMTRADENRDRDPLKNFEATASAVPICFVCYMVLSDLYKSYAEFSQLRNKNSFLGSKLLELENHYRANKDLNRAQFQPKSNHRDRDPLKYQNRNNNASHFSQEINLQSQNANFKPMSNSNHRVGHGPSSAPAPAPVVPNDCSISDHLITSDLPLQAASRLHSHIIRNIPLQYQIKNEHPNRNLIAGQPTPQNSLPSEAPLPEDYGLEEGHPGHTGHPPLDFVKLEVFEDETGNDNMDLENSRDLTEEEEAGDGGDYEDESMSSYPSSSFLMEATLGTAGTGTGIGVGIGNYAAPSTSSAAVGSGDIDPFDSQHVPLLLRLQQPPTTSVTECHGENEWKIVTESDSTGTGTGTGPAKGKRRKPKPRSYYLCSVENCGSSFTVKSSLQRHLDEVHNMSREFSCPHCSKEFARSRLDRFKSHLQKCQFRKSEPT